MRKTHSVIHLVNILDMFLFRIQANTDKLLLARLINRQDVVFDE